MHCHSTDNRPRESIDIDVSRTSGRQEVCLDGAFSTAFGMGSDEGYGSSTISLESSDIPDASFMVPARNTRPSRKMSAENEVPRCTDNNVEETKIQNGSHPNCWMVLKSKNKRQSTFSPAAYPPILVGIEKLITMLFMLSDTEAVA